MSLDEGKWWNQIDDHPEVNDCIGQSKTPIDARPSYEFLYNLKGSIPKELYAFYFRRILQMNTANVSIDLRLKMFEGVEWEDIMYQDELDAINGFDEEISIYRGADKNEEIPGISWTIRKHVAIEYPFNRGRVFKAVIPKKDILLYLAHEEDEGEIIAHVSSGYEIIEEDYKPVST